MSEVTPEMETLKVKLKTTWNTGDYGVVAKYLESSAMEFLACIPIDPGTRVLDVACGSGQAALPAARAGAVVTGVDIAPKSIEQARARAEAEGLDIRFDEGDVEMLPYEDASFDLVISLIGAMFAPRPERVAAELVRVCRPGGRIVMANWTPEGFIGLFLKTIGKHVPPPSLMPSPLKWGDEAVVRERLSHGVADLLLTKRTYPFRYPFPHRRWWNTTASITDLQNVHLLRSTRPGKKLCATIWSNYGQRITALRMVRHTSRLKSLKSWQSESEF